MLFPILPREGRAPIKPKKNVRQVSKDGVNKSVGEEEKEEQKELRKVRNKEQYLRHAKQKGLESENEATAGENKVEGENSTPYKHFDIYI